ncbi:MAG: hypothetical protein ACYDIE_11180 [Candidatus Krumholzibacteriia bacterium]
MPHPHVPFAAARRAAFLVLLSLLLAGVAFAGSPGTAPAVPPARTAGLTFLVADDFQLSGFDGTLLSWRTRGEDGRGWRLGLQLSGSLARAQHGRDVADTFQTYTHDRRRTDVRLSALRVHERSRGRALGYYWALGPTAGWQFYRESEESYYGGPPVTRMHNWQVGLAGAFGAEWRANDGLSLLAEYGLSLTCDWYDWRYQDQVSPDDHHTSRDITLDAHEARLGVTVWFR